MACEAGLRMRATPEELAALDRHRVTTSAEGARCSCGWLKTLDEICADGAQPLWEMVLGHLEESCRTSAVATGVAAPERLTAEPALTALGKGLST